MMKKNSYLIVSAHVVPTMANKTLISCVTLKAYCKFLAVRRWKKSHIGGKYVGAIKVLGYVK